jgi:GxxExxY protein
MCVPSEAGAGEKASFSRRMKGMQMDEGDARLLAPLTERIIGCAFRVANALGHGFVEKVYENALAHEMRKCGLGAVQQRGIIVLYDDVIVGEFTADLLVEDQVIVELKVVGALSDVHLPQCRNYLRATGKPLCLLINFGRPKVEIRRVTAQA